MLKKLDEVYQTTVFEKDEHKTSQEYKKLSPKMRNAVDIVCCAIKRINNPNHII